MDPYHTLNNAITDTLEGSIPSTCIITAFLLEESFKRLTQADRETLLVMASGGTSNESKELYDKLLNIYLKDSH